jgi:hypothetical protein
MNIVPFDTGKVPAALSAVFAASDSNDLVGNSSGMGFPVVSIKGKVFHITRGGEKQLITKPGEDDPAPSIEVVVIKANPNKSKVFYANGYQEGKDAKPDCYSNDGITPAADAQEAQSVKCATCAHNQWGSHITDSGKKSKACSDSRRLAIATVDTPADPMLIRVPAASMKALEEYGKILVARGVRPEMVVTRIGFDYSVAHPQLTFKPVGLIGDITQLTAIKHASESALAAQIAGVLPTAATDPGNEDAPASDTPDAPAAPAPAPAPAAAAPAKPAAPVKPAVPKKANVAVSAGTPLEAQISGMLEDMGFDDQAT